MSSGGSKHPTLRGRLSRRSALHWGAAIAAGALLPRHAAGHSEADAPSPAGDRSSRPRLVPHGYEDLIFAEEFDGPALDWSRWADEMWYGRDDGFGIHADRKVSPDLWPLSGSTVALVMRMTSEHEWPVYRKPWVVSMLSTDPSLVPKGFATQYGYFEARMRVPRGPGPWPAFWLMPQSNLGRDRGEYAEIDVMEVMTNKPTKITSSLHFDKDKVENKTIDVKTDLSLDFHVYGVSWEEDYCRFYFDGRETFRARTPENLKQPMYIILSMTMGGWDRGNALTAATPLPVRFEIDYVRVWKRQSPKRS
jgi:beta-glucanase (GH16 family)